MTTSSVSKWYTRKRPTLQIKILEAIATEGQLSKRLAKDLTGSHYPDVSDAIEKLLKSKLILISEVLSNERDKRFFKLSRRGLESFIDLTPAPEKFWTALSWFCKLSKRKIDWDTFDSLYFRFQNVCLGYVPHHGNFFQSRFIDKLFKKWLNDNEKIYDPARDNLVKGVVVSQRVLECLGVNRSVTYDELCQHIEEQRPNFEHVVLEHEVNKHVRFEGESSARVVPKEEIKCALEYYTLSANYSRPYHSPRPGKREYFDQRINEYIDFIQHLVVVYQYDKYGNLRYELSLFGIALLLTLIVYYYWNPEKLFFNDLKFEEYCKKLALNYQDKLPLVFGKWNSLTNGTLQRDKIASEILRLLFFDHTRTAMLESSVILGGVKEYYEDIEVLGKQTYLRLSDIHKSGEWALQQLGRTNDHYRTELLSRKIDEIYNSLKQRDLLTFMEGLWHESEPDSLIKDPSSIHANELRNIETAYSDEISFLFYIFLYVHDPSLDRYEPVYSTYFPSIFKEVDAHKASPMKLFVDVLGSHEDVQQLLVNWINDSTKCQNDVHSLMSHFKDYV